MIKFLTNNLLQISVFITGACVLIVEIIATRILSPHFGNTIFTVSSVVSIILAALSIGYYFGGIIADRNPDKKWFFSIILASGVILLIFHMLGKLILPFLSSKFSIASGPLIASVILFFPPALLLGMLSPYAVKLQSVNTPKKGVGSVSGVIFFWSTLGSIFGSLLSGFFLIPSFGIDNIIIANSIALFGLGYISLFFLKINIKKLLQIIAIFITLLILAILTLKQEANNFTYLKDGIYEKIAIVDWKLNDRPARILMLDKFTSSAMFLDTDDPYDLAYEYTSYYSIYKLIKPEVSNALVIGGGAYSIPKALLSDLPRANIDVSEIEPSLLEVSKKYFNLKENSRLRNVTEDGRRFLSQNEKKYDLIFSDVFSSLFSVPAHFTTLEFFSVAKNKLSENGLFIANIIGDLSNKRPSFAMSEIKTFQRVFPNNYLFALRNPKMMNTQNIVIVGINGDKKIDFSSEEIMDSNNLILKNLKSKLIDTKKLKLHEYPIFTDDYSPIEYLTSTAIKRSKL